MALASVRLSASENTSRLASTAKLPHPHNNSDQNHDINNKQAQMTSPFLSRHQTTVLPAGWTPRESVTLAKRVRWISIVRRNWISTTNIIWEHINTCVALATDPISQIQVVWSTNSLNTVLYLFWFVIFVVNSLKEKTVWKIISPQSILWPPHMNALTARLPTNCVIIFANM